MTNPCSKSFRSTRRATAGVALLAVVAVGACGDDTPTDTCSTDPEVTLENTTFAPALNVTPANLTALAGVFTEDRVVGTGAVAEAGDVVEMSYTGWLPSGAQFDSNTSFSFILGLSNVILGWHRGIEGMQVGGTRLLVIPPSSGYGLCGFGPIPGNTFLVFEVEMVSLTPAS